MKLYGYWRSTSSWRVRIALHLKGIPFEYAPVHLVKDGGEQFLPAHLARNPMAQVPVLEWEEQGQVRRLAQSMAIIEYLDETHPSPPLLPRDPFERARARMLAEHVNAGIQPFQNQATLKRVKALLGEGADKTWAHDWIERALIALEVALQETAGAYCLGDSVSLPDLLLVPQLYGARRFHVSLTPFPTLVRIDAALAALPAFQAALPENQIDAPPQEKR